MYDLSMGGRRESSQKTDSSPSSIVLGPLLLSVLPALPPVSECVAPPKAPAVDDSLPPTEDARPTDGRREATWCPRWCDSM